MRKTESYVNKLEPLALDGKIVGYTDEDIGCLVYVRNRRKMMTVQDLITKENEVRSIADNPRTPDLLDDR